MSPRIDVNANMVLIRRELKIRPLCVHDCAAFLRITRRNAIRYLNFLYESGETFISGWRIPRRGPAMAIYSPGKGEDVPRPPARPAKDRKREIARKRRAIRALVKADPLLAAFFRKPRRRRKAAPAAEATAPTE